MELIYEGKGKKVFQSPIADEVILFFKDELTAFNALKKGQFAKKGEINCKISTLIFKAIEENKLTLNQTIEKYFPTIENAKKITIGNLLNH